MFPTADVEDISQVTSLNRNTSSPRDVQYSPENTQVAKQNNNRELTLNMLIKEMVFCIALALTTYGALHNTPTKVSKHPQAVRFFSPQSLVTDWYRGQLSNALASVNNADISFVMYYAPWDAESQYVRGEFEKSAEILSDRVHFSAINCWNPGSECRLHHNKIPSWPILMVYTINSRGVLYKGPRDAHNMVKFLELIMKPLERVSCTEDLVNLLSICDAVAVGYTPLIETSKFYNVWYNVALKTREFDVMGEICFATVTSVELAVDLGVDSIPSARLMLWNDTKEYRIIDNDQLSWNETSLITWVLQNFIQPVARIMPLWKKSFNFDRYVDGNPILLLFTPLNPLYEQWPSFSLLREVAMEYYNCKNNETSQWILELMKLQQVQRLLYQQKDFVKFCQEYKFKKPSKKPSSFYKKHIVSQNNKYPWTNTTEKVNKNGLLNCVVKRGLAITKVMESADETELLASLGLLQECSTKILPAEKSFYQSYEQCQFNEDKSENEASIYRGDTEILMLPFEDDPLSPENLIQENVKHLCKIMKFAQKWGPITIPAMVDNSDVTPIRGLACTKNFTLNMIAIDSIQNHHFAESLGIDIANKKDNTAVVILDSKHESQYLLSEEYSAKTLRDFIYNFTHKNVKRSLRTHVEKATYTHYYGSAGVANPMDNSNSSIQITDLTTRTFRKIMKTPGVVSIVVVCGGGCSAGAARAALGAARLLAACGLKARAARLDARRHDLPWHLTAATYPTAFVFTHRRGGEADSAAYPAGARITSSGLVALALRSLGTRHRLRVRLALCATAAANIEKTICLKDLKEHMSSIIGRNLKYWRRSTSKKLKGALGKRLEHLHRVSLDLSLMHITDLREDSSKQMSLLNSLNSLSENWDIDFSFLRKNVSAGTRS